MNIKKWFERSSKAVKETAQTIKDTYVLPKDATDTRSTSEGMLYMQTPDGKTVITISISNKHDEVKAKKLVSLDEPLHIGILCVINNHTCAFFPVLSQSQR